MHVSARPILFRMIGADLSTPFAASRTPRKIAPGVALGAIHSSFHGGSRWSSPSGTHIFRGVLNINYGQNRYIHGNGNGNGNGIGNGIGNGNGIGRPTESSIMVTMDN